MIWWTIACHSVEEPPSDILLIVVDTLRADNLKAYGGENDATENMDRLALEGTVFTRAYAQSSWTLPSFVSLWTGEYAFEHRVGRSPTDEDQFGRLPEEAITLAERLKEKGYETAAVINNTFLAPDFGTDQGFDTYLYEGADNSNLRSAMQTTSEALEWLESSKGPRFLVVHYMEPHMHLEPPSHVRGRYLPKDDTTVPVPYMTVHADRLTKDPSLQTKERVGQIKKLYAEEIKAVDLAIGNLLEGFRAKASSDASIFLTADHGEEFWDHGQFEHGHSLLSEVVAVPLIAVGPGFSGGHRSSIVVEHVDLHKTIAQRADVSLGASHRGHDLMELVKLPKDYVRWSVAENTLYGPPLLGLTTPTHRLVLNQSKKSFKVWSLDEKGREEAMLSPSEQERIGTPLLGALGQFRGNLSPIESVPGLRMPDQQIFQQLKALGYLNP